jgi:hypothetical protein
MPEALVFRLAVIRKTLRRDSLKAVFVVETTQDWSRGDTMRAANLVAGQSCRNDR